MSRSAAVAGSCFIVALSVACEVRPTSPAPSTATVSSDAQGGPARDFTVDVFVDHASPTHAGPGPHPTTESNDYALTSGGIRWFAGGNINYWIRGPEDVAGGNTALETAAATLDALVTSRTFTRVVTGPTANPCGDFNTVLWAPIDGPGGALASASVCRTVGTKEIVGFVLTLDTSETWSTNGAAGTFDVGNAATHEWGHIAGLGHVNGAPGGCLTMYRFGGAGETQKRTLGLGDKLGLDVLYGSGNTTPGPGCGN